MYHAEEKFSTSMDMEELQTALKDIGRDTRHIVDRLRYLYHSLNTEVHHQAREHPLLLLGAAFGFGFVLGGGIFSRLLMMAIASGVRSSLTQSLPMLLSYYQEREDEEPAAVGREEHISGRAG